MPGLIVSSDVQPNAYFKIMLKTRAPNQTKHYSAGYRLIDQFGNYFGDKVVLDVQVEDDCSESVILQEMMDNVDMNVSISNDNQNPMDMRNARTSMMIHKPGFVPPQPRPQVPTM